MKIIADTHSLFWYFTADKRLSKLAKEIIDKTDKIFIPTVVLAELLYLFNKKMNKAQFNLILTEFKENPKYVIVSLDVGIIEAMIGLTSRFEIHDAAIVATAILLNASLITKDENMRQNYLQTIW